MKRKKYSDEFKQQILDKCRLVGNVALVACHHEISKNTIYTWIKGNQKKVQLNLFPRIKKNNIQK